LPESVIGRQRLGGWGIENEIRCSFRHGRAKTRQGADHTSIS
jgi:hypothetical protein